VGPRGRRELRAAARAPVIDEEARQKIILAGFTNGWYAHTSASTTDSALDAVARSAGRDLSFAAKALYEVTQVQESDSPANLPLEINKLFPVLVDSRFPAGEAVRILMSLVTTTSYDPRSTYHSTHGKWDLNGTVPALNVLRSVLQARTDFTPQQRASLELAGHLLVDRTVRIFDKPEVMARFRAAYDKAVADGTFQWGKVSGSFGPRWYTFELGDGVQALVPDRRPDNEVYRDDPEAPKPWDTATEIWLGKAGSYGVYAGPFPVVK
jgi:hypothetical protein